jgi:DNA-binding Xre family transcriptional regulator
MGNHKPVEWTPEERARHRAVREKFKDRPSVEELVARGELTGETVPHGLYLELRCLLARLKSEREAAQLSLGDVSERSGIDKAALSRLENGQVANPTVETLARYAGALGRVIHFSVGEGPVVGRAG